MNIHACVIGLAFASAAGAQDTIRYDFAVRVTSNTVPTGNLTSMSVATEGVFTIFALDDRSVFTPQPTMPTYQSHQILDLSFTVGSYSTGANPFAYPSQSEGSGMMLDNDTFFGASATTADAINILPAFADNEISIGSSFHLGQALTVGTPTFLTGLDLPRSIDLSLRSPSQLPDLRLSSLFAGGSVDLEVFDVDITVIPAPASAGVLAFAGLTAMRRRR